MKIENGIYIENEELKSKVEHVVNWNAEQKQMEKNSHNTKQLNEITNLLNPCWGKNLAKRQV
jgi:hypothetical protein